MTDQRTSNFNEFNGINPILNSRLQAPGNGKLWVEFHRRHIIELDKVLRHELSGTGYESVLVPSMQVFDTRSGRPREPEPDISIRDMGNSHSDPANNSSFDPYTRTMTIPDALNIDPELYPAAIQVRRVEGPDDEEGTPVAWIELLSPSNKTRGSDHKAYEEKRQDVVQNGQSLVEIDYLHEGRPIIDKLSRYKPDQTGQVAEDASAYYVSVLNPEETGQSVDIYQFGPEDPLPTVAIPLPDRPVAFYLDRAYDTTIRDNYAGSGHHERRSINYLNLPEDIDTFSRSDQDKIAARLGVIEQADHENKLNNPKRIEEPLPLSKQDIPNARLYWDIDHEAPGIDSPDLGTPDLNM